MKEWKALLWRVDVAKAVLDGVIFALCVSQLVMLAPSIIGTAYATSKEDVAEQHRYADTVLVPRFAAAWSEWAIKHPQDKGGSHYQTVDAGDVRRGHVMREAFHELDERLKQIGY